MNGIVQTHSYLTLHYRITLNSGEGKGQVFVDTFTEKPATLQLGQGQWCEGLEKPLIGQKEGTSFSYQVAAKDAYGEKNPELEQYVSLQLLKKHGNEMEQYDVGDIISFTAPTGLLYSGVLRGLYGENALIDFNHPLAGIDVLVDVALIGVL